MGNSIEITKQDILNEIETQLVNELVDEFFDWMHGSGCDLVDFKLLRPIGDRIVEKFENDSKFVEKLQDAVIKRAVNTDVFAGVVESAKTLAIKQLADKILTSPAALIMLAGEELNKEE